MLKSKKHRIGSVQFSAAVLVLLLLVLKISIERGSHPKRIDSDSEKKDENSMIIATSKTNPSFKIALFPTTVDRYVSKAIADKGIYEPEETQFILSVFREATPQSWAVDIGANVGFHTLHMASLGARVICFEPSNDTAALLKKSIQLNGFDQYQQNSKGFIKLIQAAASEVPGTGRLKRHPDSPGMTVLQRIDKTDSEKSNSLPFGLDANQIQTDIQMIRADNVLDDNKVQRSLRLLKVDAEGYELHAFKGTNLNKFPFQYIAFELFPSLLWKAGNTDPIDLLAFITSFGYGCTERPSNLFSKEITCDFKTKEEATVWYQNRALAGKNPPPGTGFAEGFHTNLFCMKLSD